MTLAERLDAASRSASSCKACLLLDSELDAADAATLRSWLTGGVAAERISRALTADGHPVSGSAIKRHRMSHQ